MSLIESVITGAIMGIGAGFGTAIGTHFSNKLVIKQLTVLEKKIKEELNTSKKAKTWVKTEKNISGARNAVNLKRKQA